MTRPVRADPPRAGDPYGTGIVGSLLAPGLAIVGLLIVALVTINLLNGQLPFGVGQTPGDNGGTGNDGPDRTPAPSNVVVVPETPEDEPPFSGAITYAKAGNIWVQTPDGATQLTDSADEYDSMPSWSPDGKYIYYIQTQALPRLLAGQRTARVRTTWRSRISCAFASTAALHRRT